MEMEPVDLIGFGERLLPDESGIQWTYVHKTGGTALLWLLDVGRVDAVFLRACWLEENNVQIEGKWRVLEPFEDSLACRHSTKSVPGMTLAVTDAKGQRETVAEGVGKRNSMKKFDRVFFRTSGWGAGPFLLKDVAVIR